MKPGDTAAIRDQEGNLVKLVRLNEDLSTTVLVSADSTVHDAERKFPLFLQSLRDCGAEIHAGLEFTAIFHQARFSWWPGSDKVLMRIGRLTPRGFTDLDESREMDEAEAIAQLRAMIAWRKSRNQFLDDFKFPPSPNWRISLESSERERLSASLSVLLNEEGVYERCWQAPLDQLEQWVDAARNGHPVELPPLPAWKE